MRTKISCHTMEVRILMDTDHEEIVACVYGMVQCCRICHYDIVRAIRKVNVYESQQAFDTHKMSAVIVNSTFSSRYRHAS